MKYKQNEYCPGCCFASSKNLPVQMNQSIIRASASVRSYNLLQFTKKRYLEKGPSFLLKTGKAQGQGKCPRATAMPSSVLASRSCMTQSCVQLLRLAPASSTRGRTAGSGRRSCGVSSRFLRLCEAAAAALMAGRIRCPRCGAGLLAAPF